MKAKFDSDKLSRLKGKVKTVKIASYDIETYGKKNIFLQGGFIDSNGKYKSFWDREKMIEYMLSHVDEDTMVFATNNAFDYMALFGHKELYNTPPLIRGSMFIHAQYKNIHTYDTKAFTKASVESLGKMLGKPKLKFNVSKNSMNMSRWRKYKLTAYNRRDCEVTRDFMIRFQHKINELGGNLKSTIGSTAMDLFRRKYLQEDIHHEYKKEFRDGTNIRDMLHRAYKGGRTEAFKRGHDNDTIYYRYDYNSLYPSVMLNPFPDPASAQLTENMNGHLNINSILKYEGVSECKVLCPYMYYPILGVYINNKLCFPIGRFQGVFTHLELREFIKQGGKILRCYKSITYTKTIRPFEKWVRELYSLRNQAKKEGNSIDTETYKLLLNNLYGKFFQSHIKNMEFMDIKDRNDDDLKQEGFTFDYGAGIAYRETPKESNQKFITPIFAVYTTAYGRLKTWRMFKELKGIYGDTDSCITTRKIPTSDELGELKLEGEYNNVTIVKGKHYSMHDIRKGEQEYKVKGVRLGDYHSPQYMQQKDENFEKSITGKSIPQMRFLSLKESIRHHRSVNEKVIVLKKLDLKDNKRIWITPFKRQSMQDSEPIIAGFKDLDSLQKAYDRFL